MKTRHIHFIALVAGKNSLVYRYIELFLELFYKMDSVSLQTTTIGSFPKPEKLNLADWFNTSKETFVEAYSKCDTDETLLRAVTLDVVNIQRDAGITVVTDGEVRRDNYIYYLCRSMNGVNFERQELRSLRCGAYENKVPVIDGKVSLPDSAVVSMVAEWKQSQDDAGTIPLKITIPGPMTIIDTTFNEFYENTCDLAGDLATAISSLIDGLTAAGCVHIQLDEPLFARKVDDALAWGIAAAEHCFRNCPETVCKTLHCCCGYPRHMNDCDYKKADPRAYATLANPLEKSIFDQISIEDAHRNNDLSVLLPLFKTKTIVLGVLQICSSKVETVEQVRERASEALKWIDSDRLILAPDCGLAYCTPDLAEKKLNVLGEAARTVKIPY